MNPGSSESVVESSSESLGYSSVVSSVVDVSLDFDDDRGALPGGRKVGGLCALTSAFETHRARMVISSNWNVRLAMLKKRISVLTK